uniref:Uncharacterized protein n=1 Tax=Rhizophora mucronata TaxID=61149 RepID=A0A2P2IY77_RHIMU
MTTGVVHQQLLKTQVTFFLYKFNQILPTLRLEDVSNSPAVQVNWKEITKKYTDKVPNTHFTHSNKQTDKPT